MPSRHPTTPPAAVHDVAMSPAGGMFLSAGVDGVVRLWTLAGTWLRALDGHGERINRVAFTPDGRAAVSASDDHTIRVWDVVDGRCAHVLTGHEGRVVALALAGDGMTAVSASWDGSVRVWDIGAGACRHVLEEHGGVRALALTADGRRAISASEDWTVRVWDLATGACVATLTGHVGGVRGVMPLTPDGRLVASWGREALLRVWDVDTATCVTGHDAQAWPGAVTTIRPDGRFELGGWDGQVQFLRLRRVPRTVPVVTAVRRWRVTSAGRPGRRKRRPRFRPGEPLAGRWEAAAGAACPRCGRWFAAPPGVLDAARAISRDARTTGAPCLSLPREAWNDPALSCACPRCGSVLRFAPFVVDARR
jgi:WD40 repeat protein